MRQKAVRTKNCSIEVIQMPKSLEKQRISGAHPRALAVALSLSIYAQLVAPPVLAQNPPAEINIVVVNGEGAINNVGQRSTRDPAIRVEDESHKAVVGAAVVFSLPTDGASGEFGNGSKTLIVTTDPRGQATATNLKVNQVPGKLQIHVSASYKGRTARTNITQFSMSVPGKRSGGSGSGKTLLILLAVAGAAAAGGVLATSGKGSNPASTTPTPTLTPISITPGPGAIGGPR
jgi:hypothetical protein